MMLSIAARIDKPFRGLYLRFISYINHDYASGNVAKITELKL